jgi:hypothetical protein
MARGRQLSELIEQLQAEARLSTATSRGVDNREQLKQLLRRVQEFLYEEYFWPFLKAEKASSRKTLSAGQRYYDFPAGINAERIQKVWHEYGDGIWIPIERGIGPEQYNEKNSDNNDERSDPVIRWDFHGESQFEVWPLPASNGGEIWFEAMKPLSDMVAESDTADLDDRVIVLHAAAEVLAADGQKDAQAKLDQARRRILKLLGNSSAGKRVVMGGAEQPSGRKSVALRVAYVRE